MIPRNAVRTEFLSTPISEATGGRLLSHGPPRHFHMDRDVVLNGERQWRRRVDLEIVYGGWNRAPDFDRAPLTQALEGDLPVVGGLASELDLQVRKDGWHQRGFFGYVQAHGDQRKLAAARHLKHMKVAVGVAGVKRLDGDRDQEIALSGAANSLTAGRVADAIDLVQRVRNVIGERGLFESRLPVGQDLHRKRAGEQG